MKIFNKIVSFLLIATVLVSCYNDYGDNPNELNPEFSIASEVVLGEIGSGFYNLLDLQNASTDVELTLDEVVGVNEVIVFQSFNGGEDVQILTITSFPTTFEISLSEAVANVDSLLATDLVPGDAFIYTFDLKLTDGRTVKSGSIYSVPSSCPSAIPTEGTWTGVTQEGAFGVFSTNVSVTLTDLGGGNYSISDGTGGFYTAFGFPENQPVQFVDVCNTLTITGNDGANFNLGTNASKGFPAGSWDPVTETITLPWYDSGNDFGDVTVLTRN
ncbi:MAG: hypothetical protein L3J06_06405 [Cyclobacteriaceae bacterium]|nr:hypothetical protein [Cyclobacteriaceae bacterium]